MLYRFCRGFLQKGSIISRRFHCDYINLGFSGSTRAEDTIAKYIAGLDMSLFVYDYDYNAPTADHLRDTHEKMFQTIRNAYPGLPIIILSRPKITLNETEEDRRQIIASTYQKAMASGDNRVFSGR